MTASPSSQRNSGSLRSISIGTLWRLLRYPFIILSAIVIPRLMGTSTYGQFALFLSIYMILDMVTDIGFTQVFGRFLPEMERSDHQRTAHFLHEILVAGIVITISAFVVAGVPLYLSGKFEFRPLWWALLALLLLISKVKGTLFAFLYGRNEIARFSAREFLRSVMTLVFVVILYRLLGLTGAMLALILNEAVLLLLGIAWTREYLFQKLEPVRWASLKPFVIFGLAFYVPMFFFGLLQRAGNPMIELLTGETEHVGFFDVANQYFTLTTTFLGLIFTTLLPSLTHMHLDDDGEDIARWQNTVMTYCGIVFVLTAHALALVGKDVIQLCLGEEFAPIYPCALILTPAIPAMLIVYAGMNYTILRKEPRVFTRSVFSGFLAMLLAGLFFIPRWLSPGAAVASIIGYSAAASVILIHYRKEFAPMLAGIGKVLLLAVFLVPLHMLTFGLAWRVIILALSCPLFLALSFLFGIVDLSHARKIRAAFSKKD
jgi:O-antigen/teichoic acid export membrane protein